ncbi:MAG: hypothetical protein U1A77_09285 [Pirellulales bacterium]
MISITVSIDTSAGTLSWTDLEKADESVRRDLSQRNWYGQLNLDLDDDEGLVLVDDLDGLTMGICVMAIPALARGERVEIPSRTSKELAVLEVDQKVVQVIDPSGDSLRFPLRDFCRAALLCADSYLAQVELLRGDAGRRFADAYRPELEKAREALKELDR